ncbi:esterase/lipase family protein [Rhodoplanes sp. SY1]|uniref:esterase/lipase family protein n=1 Tax=Rhodoplanes sp. SY1 TaxID=3166646 RepID=UPI0038B4FD41
MCETEGARVLVVFIHGIGGTYLDAYWGRLFAFFHNSTELNEYDFCFWQYPTHKKPSPSLFELIFWGRRLPNIDDITNALSTDLRSIAESRNYEKLLLIGHSQGGLIAFELIRLFSLRGQVVRIGGVAVLNSPFVAAPIARYASAIMMNSNRQLSYLASGGQLLKLLVDGLTIARKGKIITVYFGAMEDPVVINDSLYQLFDRLETITGPHVWMPEVTSPQDSRYRALLRFIREASLVDGSSAAGRGHD